LYEDEGIEKWRYDAKCSGMDTELWFPPRDKDLYKPIADRAKAICFGRDGLEECPVRLQCLLYAESNNEQHGIWGGLSHRERNALKRKAEKNGSTLEEWVLAGKK
jgi:WhiB family redox-sensing transcriptional regulator